MKIVVLTSSYVLSHSCNFYKIFSFSAKTRKLRYLISELCFIINLWKISLKCAHGCNLYAPGDIICEGYTAFAM